ncbi:MAG: hypothetical protein ACRD5J_19740 [Nitrososphaeraceae archaeon]
MSRVWICAAIVDNRLYIPALCHGVMNKYFIACVIATTLIVVMAGISQQLPQVSAWSKITLF